MKEVDGNPLRQVLGPVSATCVVVGAIVGVGIFFTPQSVADLVGSGRLALWTWAAGGCIAMLGALTFAELGGLYPRTGGQYDILHDAYGPPIAFVYVFCNATAIQAGAIAIIAFICAINLGVLAQGVPPAPPSLMVMAVVLIVGLAAANIAGVTFGAAIQNVTTFAKLATLVLVTCLAIVAPLPPSDSLVAESDPASSASPLALIFAGLVPVLFSYGGWQQALWMGGEVRNPIRNVPRAIILGMLIVVCIYLLTNWAYFRLLGYDGVATSEALAAEAVSRVWPSAGQRFVAGAVAFSAFGVLNAQLLSGPRLIYRMAQQGQFFSIFAQISARSKTPVSAIVLLGTMGLVLLLVAGVQGVDHILTGVVLVDAFFFLLTGLALIVIRTRFPRRKSDSIRIPFYPAAPVLFVVGEAAVMIGAFLAEKYRSAAIIGVVWVIVGVAIYVVCFRAKKVTR